MHNKSPNLIRKKNAKIVDLGTKKVIKYTTDDKDGKVVEETKK